MKKTILSIVLVLLLIPVWANSTTRTAASCSMADVNTAVSASTSGDTVIIPSCPSGASWTSAVSVGSGISLIGSGTSGDSKTQINIGTSSAIAVLNITGTARVSNIYFYWSSTEAAKGSRAIEAIGTGWRIDHCVFNNPDYNGSPLAVHTQGQSGASSAGLIDNNTIIAAPIYCTNTNHIAATWADDANFGGSDFVYIEDNDIKTNAVDTSLTNVIDSEYGGKYVIRFNHIDGQWVMVHGVQGTSVSQYVRGGKAWEVYGNVMDSGKDWGITTWSPPMWMGAGSGYIWGNTLNDWSYNQVGSPLLAVSRASGYTPSDNTTNVGTCDGDHKADGNISGGYPCRDQVGRIKDASAFAWTCTADDSCPDQTLKAAYLWNNKDQTNAQKTVYEHTGASYLTPNQDYYIYNASFNGTSGIGVGTKATMEAIETCTDGAGFWVTDEGTWATGTDINNVDHTGNDGLLYVCSSNSWVLDYTPYTYPHPLREESGGDTTAPTRVSGAIDSTGLILSEVFSEAVTHNGSTGFSVSASGGAVTASYKDGTGTTTIRYDLNRAIYQSETVTATHSPVTANNIEDAAGNDLTAYTSQSVYNGSSQVETSPAVALTISSHAGAVVTTTPSGISCGSTCSADFETGTTVTVSGYCLPNYSGFTITSGKDCNTETGAVSMSAAKECAAYCTKIAASGKVGTGPAAKIGTGAKHRRY